MERKDDKDNAGGHHGHRAERGTVCVFACCVTVAQVHEVERSGGKRQHGAGCRHPEAQQDGLGTQRLQEFVAILYLMELGQTFGSTGDVLQGVLVQEL